MSIENTTIHYIKDTMLGDFYLNNPLENKPLGRIFCQMVEFKSLENITYLSPTSVFMQDMLEAFEEFDKLSLRGYPNGGLITKQFTALAQKCADKGVKLLIGKENRNNEIGVATDKLYKSDKGTKYVFINFSEELVQEQIDKEFFCIRKGAFFKMKYRSLFPGSSEKELLCKCAALFLFHELFHVGSFATCDFDKNGDYTRLNADYNYLNKYGVDQKMLKTLFVDCQGEVQMEADDARNTIWKLSEKREIPGEFELLNALSSVPIIRLYFGKVLESKDFNDLELFQKIREKLLMEQSHLPEIGHLIEWSFQDIGRLAYVNYLDFQISIFPDRSLRLEKMKSEIISSTNQNTSEIRNQIKQIKNFGYPLFTHSDQEILTNVQILKEKLEKLLVNLDSKKVWNLSICNKLKGMFEKFINIPENFERLTKEIDELTAEINELATYGQQEKDEKEQKVAMIDCLKKSSTLLSDFWNAELSHFTK